MFSGFLFTGFNFHRHQIQSFTVGRHTGLYQNTFTVGTENRMRMVGPVAMSSAHDALHRVQKYEEAGYKYAVDMDLEKYFDTVNHSKLIEVLSKNIKDGRVISLIHKFLNAGVMIGTRFESTSTGVLQGSPLSPLLGNIMLNELDKELEKRGHHVAFGYTRKVGKK
jgi:retron-type reverse transcriptase